MRQHRDVPGTATKTLTSSGSDFGPGSASSAATTAPARGLRLGAITAVSCVAQFMIVLDSTIVTVALPAMRESLKLTAEQQQWVVDGYLVALGGLLLLAARVGDLIGHRRVFRIGLVVFTLASLAGGLASGGTLLIAARAVQGIGAAALAPSSLSLIATTHTDAGRRMKALALWSLMGGAAAAVGVVLGGVLTAELDWRWVLFVNVPIGAVLFVASGLVLPRSAPRAAAGGPRLDLPGALLATVAATILTFGFSRAPSDGWGSAQVLGPMIAAPVLLALFVLVETRSGTPLVPPSFFRSRRLLVGNSIMLCLGATMTASLVIITLYLQQCLGYSALRAGLALVPMTIVLVVGTLLSRPLLPRFGPRVLLAGGGLIAAAGIVWMADLPTRSDYPLHLLGPDHVHRPRRQRHAAGGDRRHDLRSGSEERRLGLGPDDHLAPARRRARPRRAHLDRRLRLPLRRRVRPRGRRRPRLPDRVPVERRHHAAGRTRGPDPAPRDGDPPGVGPTRLPARPGAYGARPRSSSA